MGVQEAADAAEPPVAAIEHGTSLAILDGGQRVQYCAPRAWFRLLMHPSPSPSPVPSAAL